MEQRYPPRSGGNPSGWPFLPRSPAGIADPEATERYLTARLLAGTVDPADYRSVMARIASVVDDRQPADEVRRATRLGYGFLAVARSLSRVLPELSLETVTVAVNLARFGATVEDLTRLTGVTAAQALRITVATPGSPDHG